MEINVKILHDWTVTLTQKVSETGPENVGGQTVQVTREVEKPVATRMAIRDLTRHERRAAELFHAGRIAFYVKEHGLLLASELTNRLINTSGGVLSDREKERVEKLRARHVELDLDISRAAGDATAKAAYQTEQASIRSELANLNAINEQVYSQTAEAKAQNDLSSWVTFYIVMVERGGRWVQYFEGGGATTNEVFKVREAFMWDLEERKDPFYTAALEQIVRYTFWFNRGTNSPEGFKLLDEEMAKQLAARKETEAKEKAEKDAAAATATTETAAAAVESVAVTT